MSVASTSAAALTAGKSVVETTLICASVAQALSTTTVCKHVKIRAAGQKVWLQMRTQQHAWALVMQHGELLAIAPLTHMLHALHNTKLTPQPQKPHSQFCTFRPLALTSTGPPIG